MSGTTPFSPEQSQFALGTPLETLTGNTTVRFLRSRYYGGTFYQVGATAVVTRAWAKDALSRSWVVEVTKTIPAQEGPGFKDGDVAALSDLVSEAWMSPALQALIGIAPTRLYLDSTPLLLDSSPIFN